MKERLQSKETSEKEKMASLLGLHYKFWHAPVPELERMLAAGGYPAEVIKLTVKAVACCKECGDWKRTLTKSSIKTTIPRHFNDRVQTDLLFMWDAAISH